MTPKEIEYAKKQCKIIKKFNNPDNLSLMQIQHKYAVEHGYKCWADMLRGEK